MRGGQRIIAVLTAGLLALGARIGLAGGGEDFPELAVPELRRQRVQALWVESKAAREHAWQAARKAGWEPEGTYLGARYSLQALKDGRLYVYTTCNVNAAISTAANLIRNISPYSVNGAGHIIGLWDAGAARPTHREFGGRVTVRDGAQPDDHATHCGGTIGAAGVDASAMGMAPSVLIDSYEWNSDIAEMTSRAMATAGQPGTIQVSSHSYGYVTGWHGTYWYGVWPEREDRGFGMYDSSARAWDELCYNAPYFLPFKAAGNDRDDIPPATGATFYYWNGTAWVSKSYDPGTDPYADGYDNGGFDTISYTGTAKNIMTIGAVNDAVSGGVRSVAAATMTGFSGWGPTDDGRIKPDAVANGVTLYSSLAGSDSSYGIYSGTSMATPNASGSAMLLIDYYGRQFPGQAMRASTLKGLLLHTADDLDNPGPDYRTGWGLLNVKAAADLIKAHKESPSAGRIREAQLTAADPVHTYTISWDGINPIRVTLCWTDPPGTVVGGLDNPAIRLVNDLDLRVLGPGGSPTYLPYVLNPASPASPATTGDNIRDNIEQIRIASPGPGTYTIQVSRKGTLSGGSQHYSLIVSGTVVGPQGIVTLDRPVYNCAATVAVSLTDGHLQGSGSASVQLTSTAGDAESLILTETPAGSALFIGSIPTAGAAPMTGNGILEVLHGGTLTVTYQDADIGNGQPGIAQAQAAVDCQPPLIGNVNVAAVTATTATITFNTSEPAAGRIHYDLSCGPLAYQKSGSPGLTAHSIILQALSPQTTYRFAVAAIDSAGNTAMDDQGGSCYVLTTTSRPDYFTELFSGGNSNDLDFLSITFYPEESGINRYRACTRTVSTWRTDPAGGTAVSLGDDDYIQVIIPGGRQVKLYGTAYSSFFIGSNGYVTFTTPDNTWQESLAAHFALPRISALFDDLDPTKGGTISYRHLDDRSVVTYDGIREYATSGTPAPNSFQIEMFYDGRIRLTYLSIAVADGLAGLSAGLGVPDDFLSSNLSAYANCPHRADFDEDGDVDLDDFALLQRCLSGSAVPQNIPECQPARLDADTDVDGFDAFLFRNCLSGADLPPNPACLP